MTDDEDNIVHLPTRAEREGNRNSAELASELAWELGVPVEVTPGLNDVYITLRCENPAQIARLHWIITKGAMLARREYDQDL